MKIYNTLTKSKEDLHTIQPNKIKMYVCGQTVYDYCHLGHARKAIVFDMVRRWFIASGYTVIFVENITDIEDKIITRAAENGQTIYQLTEQFIQYMHEDFDRLGIMRPDVQPKATDFIPQMITIIQDLIDKDFAYTTESGDVYYRVRKFADYGKLSGKSLNDLRSGSRVEVDSDKQDPLDFVLWKAAKLGEPFWDAPFSKGRPGWHIECSAMSEEILGKQFDIHGGGQDLQFPHHENEIAQSEAHNGCKFANYWMHNGFLNIDDEKMSKSLGNFFTLREVLDKFDPEVIRFFMLKTHYRSPLNFNHENLVEAKNNLTRIYSALVNHQYETTNIINWNNKYATKFKAAMNDDFNTPLAISVLFELLSEINKNPSVEHLNLLVNLGGTIGILNNNAQQFLHARCDLDDDQVMQMIKQRKEARVQGDFKLADQIRDELLKSGVVLKDNQNSTSWYKQ